MISSIFFTKSYLHLNSSLFYNEYSVILIFLAIAIVLSIIIILLSYTLAVQKPETEKLSTYECGFEPYEDARHTFDVKFYLIAILFIGACFYIYKKKSSSCAETKCDACKKCTIKIDES